MDPPEGESSHEPHKQAGPGASPEQGTQHEDDRDRSEKPPVAVREGGVENHARAGCGKQGSPEREAQDGSGAGRTITFPALPLLRVIIIDLVVLLRAFLPDYQGLAGVNCTEIVAH